MAQAGAHFAELVLKAKNGEKGIISPSYVHLSADAEGGKSVQDVIGRPLEFFSARVELGVSLLLLYKVIG
jgi:malate dehydrogenase